MPASFVWQPGPNGGTPTNAANLNKLAVVADIGTPGTPTGDALKAAYEAHVDRTSATTGQVPTLQADGSLAFSSAAGGISSTRAAGIAAGMALVFGG